MTGLPFAYKSREQTSRSVSGPSTAALVLRSLLLRVKLLIGTTFEHLKRECNRVEREIEQPSRTIRRYGPDCRLLAPSSMPDAADARHAAIISIRK